MPKSAKKCRLFAIFDFANVQKKSQQVTHFVAAGDSIAMHLSRFLRAHLTD